MNASAREQRIADIISEIGEVLAFARTQWTRDAATLHDELRGVSLIMLQMVRRKGPLSSTDLSQMLDMDKASVSRHVAVLRELGLLDTEPSPEDRRVQLLTVSHEGMSLLGKLRERSADAYRERFAEWSDADLDLLHSGLHRFNTRD